MGRTAVGTTRTFRKRNGGSEENDIRLAGSSFPCALSSVHRSMIIFKSRVSVENKLIQVPMRSEWNGEFRLSSTPRAENSLCASTPTWTLRTLVGSTAVGISASPGAIMDPYQTLFWLFACRRVSLSAAAGLSLSAAADLKLWGFARDWHCTQSGMCPREFSRRKSTRASNAAGLHLSLAEGFSSLLMRLQEAAKP